MNIEELHAVLPLPSNPIEDVSLQALTEKEVELGITFPSDYKSFISSYGSGGISDFLYPLNPCSTYQGYVYKSHVKELLDAYLMLKQKFSENLPFDTYPSKSGLFPWAITSNADVLYWLTEGEPDEWPIVIYNSRHWKYEVYKLQVIDFIADWLNKELGSGILDVGQVVPVFSPYSV